MRNVLIITYYWPPAGGPGVQRWLNFVKYLPEHQIRPVVYIPSNPFYPQQDPDLLEEVPDGLELISRPIREPYNLAGLLASRRTRQLSSGVIDKRDQSLLQKIMLYVRGNFFVPDARVGWVKPSVNYLKAYLEKHAIDWIITTGPPHSLHLIGLHLKTGTGVRWLADFRDPWTSIHYHDKLQLRTRAARKHKQMEAAVLRQADQIVVTSSLTRMEFEDITDKPVVQITNGYDGQVQEGRLQPERFVISHIGSLLSERNPEKLWSLLGELVAAPNSFKNDFVLQLAGTVSRDVIRTIEEQGLATYLDLRGYVPHNKARQLQREAGILLLLESDREETRAIIPGKLFEYLAAGRPILALGPKGSEVERILEETGTGRFFGYDEMEDLKETLLDWYAKFNSGDLNVEARNIQQYSRKALTAKLASLLS